MKPSHSMPKLSRTNKKRSALLNGLARSLILHGKITTTQTKAKATQKMVDKLITKGKANNLSSMRDISSIIGLDATKKLIREVSPSFTERQGGYTKVFKLLPRKSDASRMAIIEIIK